MGSYRLNLSDSGYEPVEGFCKRCNEPSGCIKSGKFLSSCTSGGLSRRAQLH
jgi:hypothetical protein